MKGRLSSMLCLLGLLLSPAVFSHDARPVYLELWESAPDNYSAALKIPLSVPDYALPMLAMPEHCRQTMTPIRGRFDGAHVIHSGYACSSALSGNRIGIDYPNNNPSLNSLISVIFLNGASHRKMLAPGETAWLIPREPDIATIAADYFRFGVQHIFAGIDHLLFVACLLFIARTPRKILLTITGFTIAHSLTLALSTLGHVRLPVAPVEASIALSIVFLAHEIAVGDTRSWTWRKPILVSSSFGLLHGFGFAALLGELGLPQTDIIPALLFFNLGVEAGQLLFLAMVAAVVVGGGRWLNRDKFQWGPNSRAATVGSYLIGTVGAFWLLQRIAQF